MKGYHIAVVGATGAVGVELLRVFERRSFPVASLRAIGSARSTGRSVRFHDDSILVEELTDRSFDNEINSEDVRGHRGLIANPNCTTAIALMAIYPLHRVFGIRRVFAASYQAVSGSGARAINELRQQVEDTSQNREMRSQIYPHPIAFNVLPHVDSFLESGYTKEEMKFQNEGRKIMHLPEFRASVTCVRVPVYRAHSVAISAEFEQPVSVERAREVLAKAPGLELVDEPQRNRYPMPLGVAEKDNCQVGRVRVDCAFENGLSFWVSGDQLLKGAALNAVQIAELL